MTTSQPSGSTPSTGDGSSNVIRRYECPSCGAAEHLVHKHGCTFNALLRTYIAVDALESDDAFRAMEDVLTGALGDPDYEEAHADLAHEILTVAIECATGEPATSPDTETTP